MERVLLGYSNDMTPIFAGAIGSVTTNVLHEVVRRRTRKAPRIDLLGMQALAKLLSARTTPPKGRRLYLATLAGDLASNTAYFALVGFFPRRNRILAGSMLGAIAGFGAVALPAPLGLSSETTGRTTTTRLLTIALYTAGGLAAGCALTSE